MFRNLVCCDDLVAKQLVAECLNPNVIRVPELYVSAARVGGVPGDGLTGRALLLLHLCLERGQPGMDFCPRVLRRANPEPYQLAAGATMKPGHRYPDVSAYLCERALQPSDADGVGRHDQGRAGGALPS